MCGERTAANVSTNPGFGSSPRVRGTLRSRSHPLSSWRFIPACAGNARVLATPLDLTTVHPRVCGERANYQTESQRRTGSSPRVRGTRRVCWGRDCTLRFIPACAGNAPPSQYGPRTESVHPRVCGERVRGWPIGTLRLRFIPACAGNAKAGPLPNGKHPVHPRVCGERENPATIAQ